ncbi:hypothetical protein [Marinifilum fragile]|uniref:hypothetical protein n=1 Tax=Marinifilum fragile TaxID=570161 RepID=UPI002AA8F12A|nr:hypothetical protein [Marinifilum fragile]
MNQRESRYLNKKIRAGALQYVVALSLLIFFLMGLFMLRAHYSNLHVNEVLISQRLSDHLSSAKLLIKHEPSLLNQVGKKELEILDGKVSLKTEHWGVFDLVQLETSYRHQHKEEIFMLGDNTQIEGRPSLYLTDKRRYLSVCGDTWIGGPVYLPALGVRRSYVDGVGYYREKLIQGEIRNSDSKLPQVRSKYLERFEEMWKLDTDRDSIVGWEEINTGELKRSFKEKSLVIHSVDEIHLQNMSLKGKIKLISDKAIVIDETSQVEQCILIAPKVVCGTGSQLNCQIYARNYVEIGADSRIKYPSIVMMNGPNPQKELIIRDSTWFNGEIVVLGKQEKKAPVVKLKPNTKMLGMLYCEGTVELEGDVAGSVYTNRFLLKTRSALYENHLLNNRVDVADLDENYAGIAWINEEREKEILEYLW